MQNTTTTAPALSQFIKADERLYVDACEALGMDNGSGHMLAGVALTGWDLYSLRSNARAGLDNPNPCPMSQAAATVWLAYGLPADAIVWEA